MLSYLFCGDYSASSPSPWHIGGFYWRYLMIMRCHDCCRGESNQIKPRACRAMSICGASSWAGLDLEAAIGSRPQNVTSFCPSHHAAGQRRPFLSLGGWRRVGVFKFPPSPTPPADMTNHQGSGTNKPVESDRVNDPSCGLGTASAASLLVKARRISV